MFCSAFWQSVLDVEGSTRKCFALFFFWPFVLMVQPGSALFCCFVRSLCLMLKVHR